MKYRNKTTGTVSTQGEIRRANANTSFPRVWDADVCASLDIEPVLAAPKPSCTDLQQVVAAGVEQDAKGNWVDAWAVTNRFSEYTDEDGVTHTVEEQEAAYTAAVDAKAAASVRKERNKLLVATDFYALTDVTMTQEITAYRQALRQVPEQDGFPHTIDWPENLEE
jgi:hypothetical protein